MSEQQQGAQPTTPTQPEQPAEQQPAAQPAQGGHPDGEGQQPEPYRVFASQEELDTFVVKSKKQAERAAIRKLAKDYGFEDVDELREAMEVLRRGQRPSAQEEGQEQQPAQQGPSESEILQLKLQVAAAKNLPVALVARLQGSTKEELEADADALLGLVSQPSAPRPGIPPAPQGGQPVTFTSQQLSDPAFVRQHREAIQQAAREGRLVRS